jgi:hypothetical protein
MPAHAFKTSPQFFISHSKVIVSNSILPPISGNCSDGVPKGDTTAPLRGLRFSSVNPGEAIGSRRSAQTASCTVLNSGKMNTKFFESKISDLQDAGPASGFAAYSLVQTRSSLSPESQTCRMLGLRRVSPHILWCRRLSQDAATVAQ